MDEEQKKQLITELCANDPLRATTFVLGGEGPGSVLPSPGYPLREQGD